MIAGKELASSKMPAEIRYIPKESEEEDV